MSIQSIKIPIITELKQYIHKLLQDQDKLNKQIQALEKRPINNGVAVYCQKTEPQNKKINDIWIKI